MNPINISAEINYRDREILFIDLETTGLDPTIHEIIEIGYVRSDNKYTIKDKGIMFVKPEHIETASPEALQITGYKQDINPEIPLIDAIHSFNNIANGTMLAGWNISFDWIFLDLAFKRFQINWAFDYHRIDIMSIAFSKFYDRNEPTKLGMRRYAKYYGIEIGEEHHALEDAETTFEIYKRLMSEK